MGDPRWGRLIEYLARARAKPTFDAEEREPRLAIAAELRDVVRAAAAGEDWTGAADSIFTRIHAGRRYDLTERPHHRWIKRIPSSQELGRALACFTAPEADPVERLAQFVRAAEEQYPQLRTPPEELQEPDPHREAVLSFGALLNFSLAPTEVPSMRIGLWNQLEQTLALEWTFRRSLVEQYRLHLEFAREAECRLRAAGIDLRDMLDVQSLVHIAGIEADFWADGARERAPGDPPPVYLAACAIYHDEADYLAEWIEFHRLVGVERFFLYDNFSTDDHRTVLAPYVEDGIVTVRDWPVLDGRVGQIAAYDDCLRWHRTDARWIAFVDLDEFLFAPASDALPEVLAEYERWPAVAVRWAMFGPSGHRTKPPGLVIDNYRRRIGFDGDINMKTVAQPALTSTCLSAHHFGYPYLSAVDENHLPLRGTRVPSDSCARLRLNHYHWKSEEEYVAKCTRMRAIGRPRDIPGEAHFRWVREAEAAGADDDAILRHLPALENALGARSSSERAPKARSTGL